MSDGQELFEVSRSSSAVWLSDTEIAYLHAAGGVAQIWRANLKTGEKSQITQNKEAIRNLQGYPQTGEILFSMDAGGDENEQIYRLVAGSKTPVRITQDPTVCYHLAGLRPNNRRLIYSSNAVDPSIFDFYELNPETGRERLIYHDAENLKLPAGISPNGRWLLFNVLLGKYNNSLWLVDLEQGSTRRVPDHHQTSAEVQPAWKSDSSGFYVITDRNHNFDYVAYYDLSSGIFTPCFQTDWDVTHIALSGDDQFLAVVTNENGYSKLQILSTSSHISQSFSLPHGVISHNAPICWSPSGHTLLLSVDSSTQSSTIWTVDADCNVLTEFDPPSMPENLVSPQLRHYTSFDGLRIPYWLFVPQGKAPYNLPIVVDIHGGPEDQTLPQYCDYIQYYLQKGIAVAAPNVRGSTGYGKAYSRLDDVEKRLDSVKDIGALAEHLIAERVADPKRIAALGISYGGFMTLSAISCFPEIWACAVDFVGIYNFVTFLENTSGYRRAWREAEYGTLAHDRALLRSVSPVSRIQNVIAPILVIHGANDPRVPITETEQMLETLRQNGNVAEYIRYEDEGHGILKLKNREDCYPRTWMFLKKYLQIE